MVGGDDLDARPDALAQRRDVADDPYADVRQALEALGYSPPEIRKALADLKPLANGSQDSGDLLKVALRSLAGG